MGVGGLIDLGVQAVKGAFSDVAAKSEAAGVTRLGKDTVLAQESEFSRSPEGMKFGARMGDYDLKRQQVLDALYKPVEAVHKVVKILILRLDLEWEGEDGFLKVSQEKICSEEGC